MRLSIYSYSIALQIRDIPGLSVTTSAARALPPESSTSCTFLPRTPSGKDRLSIVSHIQRMQLDARKCRCWPQIFISILPALLYEADRFTNACLLQLGLGLQVGGRGERCQVFINTRNIYYTAEYRETPAIIIWLLPDHECSSLLLETKVMATSAGRDNRLHDPLKPAFWQHQRKYVLNFFGLLSAGALCCFDMSRNKENLLIVLRQRSNVCVCMQCKLVLPFSIAIVWW